MSTDEETPETMTQTAPYPTVLREIVDAPLHYRPGWRIRLFDEYARGEGCFGMTLIISADTVDTVGGVYAGVDKGDPITINHLFPVPAAFYDRDSWMRWLLDRCHDVDRHEGCEFFQINGERPFAPHHGAGEDPYIIWHLGDQERAGKRAGER